MAEIGVDIEEFVFQAVKAFFERQYAAGMQRCDHGCLVNVTMEVDAEGFPDRRAAAAIIKRLKARLQPLPNSREVIMSLYATLTLPTTDARDFEEVTAGLDLTAVQRDLIEQAYCNEVAERLHRGADQILRGSAFRSLRQPDATLPLCDKLFVIWAVKKAWKMTVHGSRP